MVVCLVPSRYSFGVSSHVTRLRLPGRRAYPHMMVTGSLNDPRVSFWEPAKFVAKMRATRTDDRMLVLKVRPQVFSQMVNTFKI